MNNQNPDSLREGWRPQNYIEDSKSHVISRSNSYYGHFTPSPFPSNCMQGSYLYSSLMQPFRHGSYQITSVNDNYYPPIGIVPPEVYPKYYSKVEAYNMADQRFGSKDYPNPNYYYEGPAIYRNHQHHEMSAQCLQQPGQKGTGRLLNYEQGINQELKLRKKSIQKNVIVIQSDEQKVSLANLVENTKSKSSVNQEKIHKQVLIEHEPIAKKVKNLVCTDEKSVKTPYATQQIINENKRQQIKKQQEKEPELKQYLENKPATITSMSVQTQANVIPACLIDEMQSEILHQLKNSELPDASMKPYLRYKTLKARKEYDSTEKQSLKVYNLLNSYRYIISFEKQRKYVMEELFAEEIFNLDSSQDKSTKPIHLHNSSQSNNQKSHLAFNGQITNPHNQRKESKQPHEASGLNIKTNKFLDLIKPFSLEKGQLKKSLLQMPEHFGITSDKKNANDENAFDQLKSKVALKKDESASCCPSEEVSLNCKSKYREKCDLGPQQLICDRRLRERKKKKIKKEKNFHPSQNLKQAKERIQQKILQQQRSASQKNSANSQNYKSYQLSHDEQRFIDNIKDWANKTALAGIIQQKNKIVIGTIQLPKADPLKYEPFKILKKQDCTVSSRKSKERSTKASQSRFRQILFQKIRLSKKREQVIAPNLINFNAISSISEAEQEEFQQQLNHLIKEMKNNESHGKIRIGKEYYQAKLPNYINSRDQFYNVVTAKKEQLRQRKIGFFTF